MIPEVSVVEVIKARFVTGNGTEADPARIVTGYWEKGGRPIAVIDDFAEEQRPLPFQEQAPPN